MKEKYFAYREQIRDMMLATDRGGMSTEDISEKLSLKPRQVGRIMSMLVKRGLVYRYPKGYVIFTDLLTGKPAPCYFNNSYYEWIGK